MPEPEGRPVVVLGDLNADLSIALPDRSLPALARTAGEPRLSGGGTAGNTAAALARLGVPVAFHGAVGDDGFGRRLLADLAADGVLVDGAVILRDAPTCQVVALVEPDGGRYLVVWPPDMGALSAFAPGHVSPALISGAPWLHTTGMCLRHEPVASAVLHAMRLARSAGTPVSLDLNLRLELWGLAEPVLAAVREAVELADVVLGSGPEEIVPLAGALDGGLGGHLGDRGGALEAAGPAVEAAALALGAGRRTVVARLGRDGAVAATPGGQLVRAPGFSTELRNPVGAGDAFDAGFIAARVEGLPLAEALRWGNALGALKAGRAGGARDLPDLAEVRGLLEAG